MLRQRLDISDFCWISERIVINFFEINTGGLKSLVIFVFSSLLESNFYGCLNVKIYILLTVLEFCSISPIVESNTCPRLLRCARRVQVALPFMSSNTSNGSFICLFVFVPLFSL